MTVGSENTSIAVTIYCNNRPKSHFLYNFYWKTDPGLSTKVSESIFQDMAKIMVQVNHLGFARYEFNNLTYCIVNHQLFVVKMVFLYRIRFYYKFPLKRLTSREYSHSSFLLFQSTDPDVQANEAVLILRWGYILLHYHEPKVATLSVIANKNSYLASQRNFGILK